MASSRKRKPLADLTNEHNLIPTSVLRKLVAATSNPTSLTKPPNSILRSTLRNRVSCSGSENTSIGSSNISATRGSKTVGFRTPAKGHVVHKDGICHTRQAAQKSYKDIEVGGLNDVHSLEKRKGKKIVTHATLPPSTSKNVKERLVSNPFGSFGKEKQTPDLDVSSFRGLVARLKKLGDGNSNYASCSYKNTDKGKETLNDFSCLMETEQIGKDTEENSRSVEKTYDRKKGFPKHSGSFIESSRAAKDILISPTLLDDKTKEKGKGILHAPGSEMAKEILISSPLLVDKTKEKGKTILHPPNKVEMTKDANNLRSNKNRKLDIHALTSSCPAVPRTKKCQSSDLSDGGSSRSSKSWTGPDPKTKKKGSRLGGYNDIPLEFVQQQKAYFEDVDAFELQVEEASENESD